MPKINIVTLSEGIDVPHFFLGKIMQVLVKGGIVESSKGPGGGFWLSEAARDYKAFDVLKITDPKAVSSKCLMGKKKCSEDRPCPLHFDYLACRESLFHSLRSTSLRDLAGKVKEGEIFINEKK